MDAATFDAYDDAEVDRNPVYLHLGAAIRTHLVAWICVSYLAEQLALVAKSFLPSITSWSIAYGSMAGWRFGAVGVAVD